MILKTISFKNYILVKMLALSIIFIISKKIYDHQYWYNNVFPEKNKIYTLDYYFYYGNYKYRDLSKNFPDSSDMNKPLFYDYNNNKHINPENTFSLNTFHFTNINPYSEGYTNKIYVIDFKDNIDEKWVKFQLIKDGKKDNKYYYLKKSKLYYLLK